jgi:hypothetical protein
MAEEKLYSHLIGGTKRCRASSSRFASLHSQLETRKSIIVHRLKVQRVDLIPVQAR